MAKYLDSTGLTYLWGKITNAINSILPSQSGNSGKFLTTNGTAASWGDAPAAVFWINVTYTSNNNVITYTADKTFNEITAAINANQLPMVKSGDWVYCISLVNSLDVYKFICAQQFVADGGLSSVIPYVQVDRFVVTSSNVWTRNVQTTADVFIALAGDTMHSEILEAYNAGKTIFCTDPSAEIHDYNCNLYVPLTRFRANSDPELEFIFSCVVQGHGNSSSYVIHSIEVNSSEQWSCYDTDIASFPSQTGNSGKFLTTDGNSVSWGSINLNQYLEKTGTNTSYTITTDLTEAPLSIIVGDTSSSSDSEISLKFRDKDDALNGNYYSGVYLDIEAAGGESNSIVSNAYDTIIGKMWGSDGAQITVTPQGGPGAEGEIYINAGDALYINNTEWGYFPASFITSGTFGIATGGTGRSTLTSNAVLTGNGTSAVNMVTTASGAAYATAANGALTFGTLPVAQGGTGATSFTANAAVVVNANANGLASRAITNPSDTTLTVSGSNLATMNALRYSLNRNTSVAAADTNYTTYEARGEALNTSDTNPTVNGTISWTYS